MNETIIRFLMEHPDITISLDCQDAEGLFITMINHSGLSVRIQHIISLSLKDYYMDGYFQLVLNTMYEKLVGIIDNPVVNVNTLEKREE